MTGGRWRRIVLGNVCPNMSDARPRPRSVGRSRGRAARILILIFSSCRRRRAGFNLGVTHRSRATPEAAEVTTAGAIRRHINRALHLTPPNCKPDKFYCLDLPHALGFLIPDQFLAKHLVLRLKAHDVQTALRQHLERVVAAQGCLLGGRKPARDQLVTVLRAVVH